MNRNFAIYLKKTGALSHKTPPKFERAKHGKPQHKTPPPFTRAKSKTKNQSSSSSPSSYSSYSSSSFPVQPQPPLALFSSFSPALQSSTPLVHRSPPAFTRHKSPNLSKLHKTPPIFIRPVKSSEDLDRKSHKKPPIFSKFPSSVRSEFFQNKLKNSGAWSFADTISEEAKDSFAMESSAEMSAGFFDVRRSSKASNTLSRASMNDSARLKDELKRIDPSVSIESAILNLHSEIQPFQSDKESEVYESKEMCNFRTGSDYSSAEEKKEIPMPKFNLFSAFTSTPQIEHKLPPAFNRQKKEKIKTIPTLLSSLSNSASISPISSTSNSPDSRISRVLDQVSEVQLLQESPISFTSNVSEVSPSRPDKSLLKLRSSLRIDSILDKSKNLSPFVSNNFFDKPIVIPMKPLNYIVRSTETTALRFCGFDELPEVPEYDKIEFNYPSVRMGNRGSSNTVFVQTCDLPDNIKLRVNLSPAFKQYVKMSKYSMKNNLTSKEIELMAKRLAKDLIERNAS